ncbi:MAG TPA: O-antigen ligase family protein, partial [Geopsychrobacteraceae bacterium]|nr:O-antigen ligase family protein [Geopsychrobacteraceae bacterium]
SVLTLCLPIVAGGIGSDRVSIGTFYDPNDMAMFVSCSFPFLLYLLHNKTGRVKLFTLSAIILGVITVIATQSRMGFIALLLNGFFYLILSPSSQSTAFRKFIVLFSVFFVFTLFAGNFYWDRIKTTFEEGQTGSGRTLVWERGLQIAVENPLTGTGPGTFISAYGRMLQGGQFEEVGNEYDRAWKAAHNSYLVVAAELGFAGLVFFLMIIRTSLGQLNRVRKHCVEDEGKDHLRILANVSISSFCVFLFCALFLSQAYSSLFMALVACSVLVGRIYQKESLSGSGEQVDT